MPSLSLPNLDLFDSPSTGTVTVHSNPTGAEARASNGSTCRTPCALSMPLNEGFIITYSLDGYLPETVAVKSIPPQKSAIIDMTPAPLRAEPGLGGAGTGCATAATEKAAALLRLSNPSPTSSLGAVRSTASRRMAQALRFVAILRDGASSG